MDGLDRLIEMLEKRFGKFWADALLVIVVLGAVGWALNAFVSYLVIPLARFAKESVNYVRGAPITVSAADARVLLIQATTTVVLSVAGYFILRFLFGRWKQQANVIERDLENLLNQAQEESALLRTEYDRLEKIRTELKNTLQEQITNGRELQALIGRTKTRVNAKHDGLDERSEKEKALLGEIQDVFEQGIAARSANPIAPEDE